MKSEVFECICTNAHRAETSRRTAKGPPATASPTSRLDTSRCRSARIHTLDPSQIHRRPSDHTTGSRSTPLAVRPCRRPKPRAAPFSTADAVVCLPTVAICPAGRRHLQLFHAPRQSRRPPLSPANPRLSPKPLAAAVYIPVVDVPKWYCCLHVVASVISAKKGRYNNFFIN